MALRIWFGAIAAVTVLILVIGGITRLTHSGLSIVDWQPVTGIVPPLNDAQWTASFARYQQFPEFKQVRPYMTLDEYKSIFFWEYVHRLTARAIGLVFLIPFAWFYLSGALTRPLMTRALSLFALGALQGVAGWLMVRSGLVDRPNVSHYRLALHLMLAVTIFGLCVWLIRDLSDDTGATASATARARLRRLLIVLGCVLGLQIVWGAFVAGLKAGFVFNTFPLMGSALIPSAYFTFSPTVLNLLQHPAGVQWMHRLLGSLLVIGALMLVVVARRAQIDVTTRRYCIALFWSIAAQYALGVLTLLQLVPTTLAVTHQAMAMAIVAFWVCAIHRVQFVERARDKITASIVHS